MFRSGLLFLFRFRSASRSASYLLAETDRDEVVGRGQDTADDFLMFARL